MISADVESLVESGPLLLAAGVAAAAGLVSFLSPCVLPLVPGYLSYVTGLTGQDIGDRPRRFYQGRVLLGSVLFVVGFSAVFVSYGALFGGLGRQLTQHQRAVDVVLGSVTIALGLVFAGLLSRIPLLHRDFRVHRVPAAGLVGAPLLGVLFGVGWTPCIGPTLGVVNGLALESATAGRGALLSLAYCLGLGLPFVLTGLAFRRALGAFAVVKRHYRVVMVCGGALLVALGVLEVTGAWSHLLLPLQSRIGSFETPV